MRVVVVEDQLLTREGVVRMHTHVGMEVVGTVGNVPSLLQIVALQAPDAVVLDVRLPPTFTDERIRAAEELRRHHPEVAVLVLSHYVEAEFATALLRGMDGGVGYLLKDRILTPSTLSDALNRVAAGECVVDPALVAALLAQDQPDGPHISRLSTREQTNVRPTAVGPGLRNEP